MHSHLTGGNPGGQAEYVCVPYSDIGPIVVPDGIHDEKVLLLSDILPPASPVNREAVAFPARLASRGAGDGQSFSELARLVGKRRT